MQALVVGSGNKLSKILSNFNVVCIDGLDRFEEAKKLLDIDEPCLFYKDDRIRIEDPEEIWNFHKTNKFSIINATYEDHKEICSFIPKITSYNNGAFSFIGIPFTIANKYITLEAPETVTFSVITCIGDIEKYNRILLPSLHSANKYLLDNGIGLFETVSVYGRDFKTIGEAYNHAISISKSKIKIFVHDDMDLMDPSWVLKVLLGFADPKVGLIGLVGSTNPSYTDNWWMSGKKYIYGRQFVGADERKELWHWNWYDIPPSGRYDLRLVDGSFMATNREVLFEPSSNKNFFLTPYEHDIGKKILDMNLKIGIINHTAWHYAYPKKDKSTYASTEEFVGMINEL